MANGIMKSVCESVNVLYARKYSQLIAMDL